MQGSLEILTAGAFSLAPSAAGAPYGVYRCPSDLPGPSRSSSAPSWRISSP